ncbi:MAG: Eco57I restriction-modification methylase domain-containing protein, partial [Alphaproteobacteria bacterium]|nr:Eco57I restriction-modification methylase domain-containing protein [Alphaproteobacteria bacterium]
KLKINKEHTINEIFAISEINNTNREQNSAFYTPEKTVFELLNKLDLPKSKTIKILEPSVGVGNFIPYIFKAFSSYDLVELDLLDIDSTSLSSVKKIIGMIGVPNNFKINYINKDFFDYEPNEKYDLIIGNPPYGTVSTDSSNNYRIEQSYSKINNLFILFMEKSLKISKQLSFIIPKSFLSAPQYEKTRHIMEKMNISCIVDFGEKGFEGVKIETVGISLKNSKIRKDNKVYIKSIPLGLSLLQKQQYICDKNLPYWVIYRNEQFDNVLNKMKLGVFTSFRDRQILKKHINNENKGVPLLKARNIGDRKIEKTLNNAYIENIENFTISKKMNEKLVMIPNLSYSPRACWLPEECAVDGSVALLEPIDDEVIEDRDLAYYSSEEFNSFYRIARNYSTRSLNIDRLSVQFFGVFR